MLASVAIHGDSYITITAAGGFDININNNVACCCSCLYLYDCMIGDWGRRCSKVNSKFFTSTSSCRERSREEYYSTSHSSLVL